MNADQQKQADALLAQFNQLYEKLNCFALRLTLAKEPHSDTMRECMAFMDMAKQCFSFLQQPREDHQKKASELLDKHV